MTADTEQDTTRPAVIEGPGRYVVYAGPDGGWVVGRAVGICDRCQDCGCGDQAEPIRIPAMVLSLAQSGGGFGMIRQALRSAAGRG